MHRVWHARSLVYIRISARNRINVVLLSSWHRCEPLGHWICLRCAGCTRNSLHVTLVLAWILSAVWQRLYWPTLIWHSLRICKWWSLLWPNILGLSYYRIWIKLMLKGVLGGSEAPFNLLLLRSRLYLALVIIGCNIGPLLGTGVSRP